MIHSIKYFLLIFTLAFGILGCAAGTNQGGGGGLGPVQQGAPGLPEASLGDEAGPTPIDDVEKGPGGLTAPGGDENPPPPDDGMGMMNLVGQPQEGEDQEETEEEEIPSDTLQIFLY